MIPIRDLDQESAEALGRQVLSIIKRDWGYNDKDAILIVCGTLIASCARNMLAPAEFDLILNKMKVQYERLAGIKGE